MTVCCEVIQKGAHAPSWVYRAPEICWQLNSTSHTASVQSNCAINSQCEGHCASEGFSFFEPNDILWM